MSFRFKLLISFFIVNFLSLSVFYFWATQRLEDFSFEIAAGNLEEKLRVLVKTCSPHDPDVDRLVDRLAAGNSFRITVTDRNGTVLADSEFSGKALRQMENHGNRPEIATAFRYGIGRSIRFSTSISKELLYIAQRTEDGSGVVRISKPPTDIDSLSEGFRSALTIVTLVLLVAGGIAVWVISHKLAGSIRRLSEAAKRTQAGRFAKRIPVESNDEVGELARQMEQMSESLEQQVELLESERNHLNAVLNSMVEGVLVTDGRGRVTASNPSLAAIFGLEQDPLGKLPIDVIRNPEVAKGIESVVEEQRSWQTEVVVAGKVLLAKFSPIGEGVDLVGVVIVFHDISELRRLERLQKDFVSNVSHELKTPLTSIQGFAETLHEEESLAPIFQDFAGKIYNNASQLSVMIEDLFNLARLERGEPRIQYTRVRFESLLEDLKLEFIDQLQAKKIDFIVENRSAFEYFVAGERYLRRVFRNLIENAVKYTEEGELRIGMSKGSDEYVFSVQDTGIGIPEEDQERIFERFYRVDKDRSRRTGGSGIGLAIVKHIVQLHDGRVWVESEIEKGTTIFFTLPVREHLEQY